MVEPKKDGEHDEAYYAQLAEKYDGPKDAAKRAAANMLGAEQRRKRVEQETRAKLAEARKTLGSEA